MKLPAFLLILMAVVLPARLRGDEVDETVGQLSSREPSALYNALTSLRDSRDARLMKPLWNILMGEELVVMVPDNRFRGTRFLALKPLARDLLAKSEGPVVKLARENLASANPRARREAAELIARVPQPPADALEPLKTMLRDDLVEARIAAVQALGKLSSPSIPALVAHVKFAAAQRDLKELDEVTKTLGSFGGEDARRILPELMPYLDADKYSAMVIYYVLARAVEPLGYRRDDTPEGNWDLVLPALARLKSQVKHPDSDKEVPRLAESLAEYIPERIAARKRAAEKAASGKQQ